MVSAFLNTVKIPELRRRVLFTLAVIVIVRLGAAITTPGVNQAVLQEWFRTASDKTGGGVAALFNLFSGGALENCAIFSLGIMPREKIAQFSSAPPLNRLKSAATPPPVLSDAVRNHSCNTAWLTPGVVIAAPKRTITITASVNKIRRRNSGILTVFRNAETIR